MSYAEALAQQHFGGGVAGAELINKFGYNADIGTALEVVAPDGVYPTPTSAAALEIVSSDADDTAEGAGAQAVRVYGIGPGWVYQTEDVEMGGQSAVDLTKTWLRVWRMRVIRSGTYATASAPSQQGTITLQADGAGAAWAKLILADTGFGEAQSQIAVYTIPAGKQALILDVDVTVETNKSIDLLLFARDNADDVTTPFTGIMQVKKRYTGLDSHAAFSPRQGYGPFVGPADIGFMAKAASAAAVSVEFEILQVDA